MSFFCRSRQVKRALIVVAHPDTGKSFNHGIADRARASLEQKGIEVDFLDLYGEKFNPILSASECRGEISDDVKHYEDRVTQADLLVFVHPVWWFRAPAMLEGFIDRVFIPGFSYKFQHLIGVYGYPCPLLKSKDVIYFMTHGAPALPVVTLYLNVVVLRLKLGFLSFCFNLFRTKVYQFWSIPFISEIKRKEYLDKVESALNKYVKAE